MATKTKSKKATKTKSSKPKSESKKKSEKADEKCTKTPTPESVKATKMKSEKGDQVTDDALNAVRKVAIDAISLHLYSSGMIGALSRNHGLDRASAEAAISEICDPILEDLQKHIPK